MTNCSLIYKLGRSSGQLRPKSPVLIYTSGRFSHPNLAKDGYRATYALKHDYSHANQVGSKVSFDTPRFSITESKKHQIKIPTWVGVLSLKLIATFCCDDWVGGHRGGPAQISTNIMKYCEMATHAISHFKGRRYFSAPQLTRVLPPLHQNRPLFSYALCE